LLPSAPSENDGALRTKLDDWDVGYSVGVLFEPTEATRVGVSYRSAITMNLKGSATFEPGGPVGSAIAGATGAFVNTGGRADLALPAALIFGISHRISPNWLVLADAQRTQWSRLRQLKLHFTNALQPDIDTELRWRDSWFFAAGVQHRLTNRWTLRGGVAYDQTPTRRATSTPAIPDADSVWVTVGAGYRFNDASKLDVVYGHIFVDDNRIALQAAAPGNALRGNLSGTIRDSAVNFFSLQYSHRF
jgi:long-chain fatty acid transport protein